MMGKGDALERGWETELVQIFGTSDAPVPVDQTGRVLGKRAQETRQRILESTQKLLDAQSLRELRVIDIARDVGASPATFYQYFRDVEEAVLALAEEASLEMPAVARWLEGSWQGAAGLERARAIVSAFMALWDHHHAVLRVRNLASDEGDERFIAVRGRAMSPVLRALAKQIETSQAAGRISPDEDPVAAAAATGAILERMAAYQRELESAGVSREHLIETSARIIHRCVTGEGVV